MDSLKNIAYGTCHGFIDSIKGIALVFYIDSEISRLSDVKISEKTSEEKRIERLTGTKSVNTTTPQTVNASKSEAKIMKQVFKCCALNGGFAWLSIVLFEYGVLPGLEYVLTLFYGDELQLVWDWLKQLLSIVFGMIWVLPIFLLSKIVSSLWFQDIANEAYRFRKGRPQLIPSISKLIADTLFSLLVQFLFLIQSTLVNLLPFPFGYVLSYVHMCLLYSLYSFEYKWFNMGWELPKRLNYIETNWSYFLGFGLPLTILTSLPSSVIVSGCVFSIIFPIFILSGNEAEPKIGICDFPLRLFSPVVAVSNLFFSRSVHVSKPLTTSTATPTRNLQHHQHYSGLRNTPDRSVSSSRSSSRMSTPTTFRMR